MGYKYEVYVWCENIVGYDWKEIYSGQSFIVSLYNVIKAKTAGYKCIKLEYRP